MDPQMPISTVDMGLVYGIRLQDSAVEIDMTFTAIACPAMDIIIADVHRCLETLPGVSSVKVNVLWNPAWTKGRLTSRAKDILRSFGIAV